MHHRQRFFFNLGTLGAGTMLVVASVAFGPRAAEGVGLGIGIAGIAASLWFLATLLHHRSLVGALEIRVLGHPLNLWAMLGGIVAGIATWQIVQVGVFAADVARWLTLANGCLVATLACAGLIVHEARSERVIHVLEVVQRPERDG
ncbi:MAG: hypothetical protein U0S48_20855 [Solirubrobacteraceae bacterium]